jgi:conserved hypothetical protein
MKGMNDTMKKRRLWRDIKANKLIYILLLPAILTTFVFAYMPMPGIIIAFQDYKPLLGPWKSPFVGLDVFKRIFSSRMIMDSVGNTVYLNVLNLLVTFPAPILLALMLNEVRCSIFKRVIQTVSYLPYFLSWISVVGLVQTILGLYGPVNDLLALFGGSNFERILFLGQQKYFIPTYLILNLWKGTGWGTVIYLAAISGIDMQLYEAATIDGANKLQQIWHITLPAIRQTAILLLIMSIGGLFGSNFELVYALQNPYIDFEVISTAVYKIGLQQGDYPLGTALNLIQGLIGFALVATANFISKKVTDVGLW